MTVSVSTPVLPSRAQGANDRRTKPSPPQPRDRPQRLTDSTPPQGPKHCCPLTPPNALARGPSHTGGPDENPRARTRQTQRENDSATPRTEEQALDARGAIVSGFSGSGGIGARFDRFFIRRALLATLRPREPPSRIADRGAYRIETVHNGAAGINRYFIRGLNRKVMAQAHRTCRRTSPPRPLVRATSTRLRASSNANAHGGHGEYSLSTIHSP